MTNTNQLTIFIPDPNPEICLTYDVMNYYLTCIKTLANNCNPGNKDVIHYSCVSDIVPWNDYSGECHDAEFTYGTPTYVPYPAQGFN